MQPHRLVAPILLSLVVGLTGAFAAATPVAAADDGVVTTANSNYTLDPAHGRIKVAVDLVVRNRIPNSVEYVTCTDYSWDPYWGLMPYVTTCPRTTRYYVNKGFTMVENAATNIRATSGGTQVSVKKGAKGTNYRSLDFTFGRIWNGQNKTIHLTYTIPGGKPRSATPVRAMRAYANFCATSHGVDGGRVQIRVPAGFDTSTWGWKLTSKRVGSQRVFSSGPVTDWAAWYACIEGSNEAGYKTSTLSAPNGTQVVLKTWPEDPQWAAAVESSIETGLTGLTRLTGHDIDATVPLVVKESALGSEYAGFYSERSNTIVVDEDFRQAALVEHELAHVWFNGGTFEDTWLAEGSAEWAARTVAGVDPCRLPTGSPGSLATWKVLTPKATDAERAAVDYQYRASCWVITKIADTAGSQRMTTAIAALLDGADPYAVATPGGATRASTPPSAGTTAASWQRWLDTVDELALEPAGASPRLAADLLLQFGVTENRDLLEARTAARTAYHELADAVDWTVPTAIRAPLAAWDFTRAQVALDGAAAAWAVTGQTDAVLAGVDARHGPVADAWEAASSASELVAARTLAQAQLAAARDVADAQAAAAAPRDIVQQIGLLGATVPSLDPAVAAVRTVDTATAASVSAAVRQSLVDATSAGQLRIGVATAVALVLLLLLAFVLVRRARRRRAAAAAESATPEPVLESEPTSTSTPA